MSTFWFKLPVYFSSLVCLKAVEYMLEEEVFVIDREEVAVNVNTLEDLKIAEHLFRHAA